MTSFFISLTNISPFLHHFLEMSIIKKIFCFVSCGKRQEEKHMHKETYVKVIEELC